MARGRKGVAGVIFSVPVKLQFTCVIPYRAAKGGYLPMMLLGEIKVPAEMINLWSVVHSKLVLKQS